MYLLKQCPKCSGDLATGDDQYGQYVSCMQCGFCRDVGVEAPQVKLEPVVLTRAAVLSKEGYRMTALHPKVESLPTPVAA
ncbi:MAG: hypothetical protein H8E48_10385 [Chloroflexi bacterium]|nr:hypothetical protein [Chloroflexota bacterium]